MKTNIINTIHQWVPETIDWVPDIASIDSSVADYHLLRSLATICAKKINSGTDEDLERVQTIAKVINLLYQAGNLYTRNAIENEFLTGLSDEESPASLKKHMDILPAELRKEYIKTILKN